MPIYEYRCDHCGRRETLFLKSFSEKADPRCSRCGSRKMTKLLSHVAVLKRTGGGSHDEGDSGRLRQTDPVSAARAMRKMYEGIGADPGVEFHEIVDRLESGQSPDSISERLHEKKGEPTPHVAKKRSAKRTAGALSKKKRGP